MDLPELLVRRVDEVVSLSYYRLVVVVPRMHGRAAILREVVDKAGWSYINVSLQLSSHLLELSERQRSLHAPVLLREIIERTAAQAVLLDHLELLFDATLKQDPLRCLQGAARNSTIVAVWPGTLQRGHLLYATPGHPEHRRYLASGLLVVDAASVEASS